MPSWTSLRLPHSPLSFNSQIRSDPRLLYGHDLIDSSSRCYEATPITNYYERFLSPCMYIVYRFIQKFHYPDFDKYQKLEKLRSIFDKCQTVVCKD